VVGLGRDRVSVVSGGRVVDVVEVELEPVGSPD
jgi:hypothetical protein